MEGPEIKFAEAVIDNGKYGKRVVRVETCLLYTPDDADVAGSVDRCTRRGHGEK